MEPPVIPALQQTYSWGLGFRNSTLSKGYILPKSTRDFAKARPIVHYSTAWARKLGSAISTLLIEILNTVFRSILEFPDVRAVIEGIRRLFTMEFFAESAHCLHEADIAGFYIKYNFPEFWCHCVCRVHVCTENRIRFRHYPAGSHSQVGTLSQNNTFSVTLRHIPAIVQYLLDNSYFTVESQVFRQCRGASMGSQFTPVLRSAVALQREWNYHLSFSPFTWDRSLHHRYVDN